MKFFTALSLSIKYLLLLLLLNLFYVNATAQSFSSGNLTGTSLDNPTSLDFGPDDRLYVSQKNGEIYAYTVARNGPKDYIITNTETISLVKNIKNHNDDGSEYNKIGREVIGILSSGTAQSPILYVSSSDFRTGGGGGGGDTNQDTNSGIISRLTWTGTSWDKVDLVRGLPRSEENHATSGMQLDKVNNILYVGSGGNTNAGAPSNNFAFLTEYALSACILAIDLNALEAMPVYTDRRSGDKFIYDIPTLNDPFRADIDNTHPEFPYESNHPLYNATVDIGDPFGGNDGLNQAKLVAGGPVQIFATGFRNIYDLALTGDGRLYTWDNGANGNWGGHPHQEGGGNVTNNWLQGSSTSGAMPGGWVGEDGIADGNVNNKDGIHFVGHISDYNPFDPNANPANAYYGGHPTPVRANPAGAGLYTHDHAPGGNNGTAGGYWRTSITGNPNTTLPIDWPPVPLNKANPVEGDFHNPGVDDNSFWAFQGIGSVSTNGLAIYMASNAGGAKQGHLLAAAFNNKIYEIALNASGTIDYPNMPMDQNPDVKVFAENFGDTPLDVIAQGDTDPFPGTVWVANFGSHTITVFEPQDFAECLLPGDAGYDPNADYDSDGYSNNDEILNNTDHCNGASMPSDADKDLISDLLDPDDDNDGIADTSDYFPIDPENGLATNLPLAYPLLNEDPGTGIKGLGFTGLMANGQDYRTLIKDKENSDVIVLYGGAPGQLGIGGPPGEGITAGDAYGSLNNQENAFQFGININATTPPFTVESELIGPLFNGIPDDFQSAGIFIGNGDQDNYIKIVANANGGQGGILIVNEVNGNPIATQYDVPGILNAQYFSLFLTVNPQLGTVQPEYSIEGNTRVAVGNPISASGEVLDVMQGSLALAVGVISTSRGSSSQFTASWESIHIDFVPENSTGQWVQVMQTNTPTARHENGYVQVGDKFYLIGGRGSDSKQVDVYNPQNKTWTPSANKHPVEMHHFQAVAYQGLIYVLGAFTGNYPDETPISKIYIYNPATDKWYVGADIPRPRGSCGVVVYQDKIYMVGGLLDGHKGDYVLWFDEYDPATATWKIMPDVPRFRDHFQAAVIGGKMVLAGGRLSDNDGNLAAQNYPPALLPDNVPNSTNTFNVLVSKVDVFDFTTNSWVNGASDIPTPRAAPAVGTIGNEVIFMGGEVPGTNTRNETEAFDIQKFSWRSLASMLPEQDSTVIGRHATQAISDNGGIYVAAGSGQKGGSPQLNTQQAFYMFQETTPAGIPLTASSLTTAASSLNFGQVPVGEKAIKTITLTNANGNQGIVITSIALIGSSDYRILTNPVPSLINPGSTVDLSIEVQPSGNNIMEGTLVVQHTGSNSNVSINLTTGVSATPTPVSDVLYRVNVGDAGVSDDPGWAADSETAPSPYRSEGRRAGNGRTITLDASVPATTPVTLFNSERYWNKNTTAMSWAFPAAAGKAVEVHIFLAETYVSSAGSRVFDILIDGVVVDQALDIFAQAGGANIGIMRSYSLISDGMIDISFNRIVENPAIKAIEIVGEGGGGVPANTAPVVSTPIADISAVVNAAPIIMDLSQVFSDAEDGTNLTLTVSSDNTALVTTSLSGSELTLTVAPNATGTASVTVRATDTQGAFVEDVFTVTVTDPEVILSGVLYRVNVGDAGVSDDPGWAADSETAPSPYRSEGRRAGNGRTITLDASVPATTPVTLFNSERYWNKNTTAMSWAFPAAAGKAVEVHIFLAETYVSSAGSRVFDILIDGVVVDQALDIFAQAGGANIGIMRSYSLISDGMIDISFNRIVENPAIKAIEIVGEGGGARYNFTLKEKPYDTDSQTVKESLIGLSANIYPNPFNDIFYIAFEGPASFDNMEFSLINTLGIEMGISNIKLEENLLFFDLSSLNLSSGIYTLKIKNRKTNSTLLKRVIKEY